MLQLEALWEVFHLYWQDTVRSPILLHKEDSDHASLVCLHCIGQRYV